MPSENLTDLAVRKAKPKESEYRLPDGKGLYLSVMPSGAKHWRYRYSISGKENMYAIGSYPEISLDAARKARAAARELVKLGKHPSHNRQAVHSQNVADKEQTFSRVFEDFCRRWPGRKPSSWAEATRKNFERAIRKDMVPALGDRPIRSIRATDITKILEAVGDRGAESGAISLRSYLVHLFNYAAAMRMTDGNPVTEIKVGNFVSKPAVVHHPKLEFEQIPEFLKALSAYSGAEASKAALHLLLLTMVRKSELRLAQWSEFDLDAEHPVWIVPRIRLKRRDMDHTVPLSTQAVAILEKLRSIRGESPFLFPNTRRRGACMAGRTMNAVVDRLGYGDIFAPNGLRATASTKLNELGYRPDVIERQLAHQEKNAVRRAYNRAEYLEERRAMMQQWADLIDAQAAENAPVALKRAVG